MAVRRVPARFAYPILAAAALVLTAGCVAEPMPSPIQHEGTTFHVDCARPGAGSGTLEAPWNDVSSIAAHGPFAPGDRILLRRGTACTGRIAPTGSGSNGHPIVLGAYGSGSLPTVHGGGTPDRTGTVQLTNVHDWVVQDLRVTNLDPSGPDDTLRAGILAADDDGGSLADIVVRRTVVQAVTSSPGPHSADPHEYGGIAVLVRQPHEQPNAFSNVRIEGNRVDHVGRTGIVVWSDAWPATPTTAVSVTDNALTDVEGDSIVLWGVAGGVLDHNTSAGGGHLPTCPRCSPAVVNTANAGMWPVDSSDILIRYNEVSGEGAAGGDGQGFDIDNGTSRVVLEGNYAHDNDGGGVLICGARDTDIRYNVLQNDGGGEISFSCARQGPDVRILNNDLYLGPGRAALVVRRTVTTGIDPVLFANNVVVDLSGRGYDWPVPVAASHNVFAGIQSPGRPSDAAATTGDPGLVAPGTGGSGLDSLLGYLPASGSSVQRSGLALRDAGSTDFLGRPVDSLAPDRGAFARPGITAPPPRAVAVSAGRVGADVRLSWDGHAGEAWRVERSADGGPWGTTTGLLTLPSFTDVAPPAGRLRYRLLAVGRSAVRIAGQAAVGPSTAASPSASTG